MAWYNAGRRVFALGSVAWKATGGSTIRAYACSAGYTFSTAHQTLADVPAASRIAFAQLALFDASTAGDGDAVLDAQDTTFGAADLTAGEAAITQFVFVLWTGDEATSSLLFRLATGFTGLPYTPAGVDAVVTWPSDGLARLEAAP